MSLNWIAKKCLGFIADTTANLEKLLDELNESNQKQPNESKLLNKLPMEKQLFAEVSYRDILTYSVRNRPALPEVKKAIVCRGEHPKGQLLIQVFVDENNQLICDLEGIPYGRKLVTTQFDPELTEAFADKPMIVFN